MCCTSATPRPRRRRWALDLRLPAVRATSASISASLRPFSISWAALALLENRRWYTCTCPLRMKYACLATVPCAKSSEPLTKDTTWRDHTGG